MSQEELDREELRRNVEAMRQNSAAQIATAVAAFTAAPYHRESTAESEFLMPPIAGPLGSSLPQAMETGGCNSRMLDRLILPQVNGEHQHVNGRCHGRTPIMKRLDCVFVLKVAEIIIECPAVI